MQKNTDKIGVIKEIDPLGRIVIPKEYRERLSFDKKVELIILQDGILIRNPEYELTKRRNKSKSKL